MQLAVSLITTGPLACRISRSHLLMSSVGSSLSNRILSGLLLKDITCLRHKMDAPECVCRPAKVEIGQERL